MKRLIKIISSVPCHLKVNNESFYVEQNIILEIIDENEIFIFATPSKIYEYFPICYKLTSKPEPNNNVRLTKYKNNFKIELFFSSGNKIKYYNDDNYKINYYNNYFLTYKNNSSIYIPNFINNYYNIEIENINENYNLIKGFFKPNENLPISKENKKISICIYSISENKIVYYDTCNKVENKYGSLKIISLMNDQNKQALICEFNTNNGSFIKKEFYSSYTKKAPMKLTKKYQISQAFFECILSDNKNLLATYLNEDLKEKVKNKDLHLMFDKFVKVDNEFLQNIDEVNLIIKIDKNIYEAITYKIEYIGNKISNIISIR